MGYEGCIGGNCYGVWHDRMPNRDVRRGLQFDYCGFEVGDGSLL
jgi:hypothetical protein